MKKVTVVFSSYRLKGNSSILAEQLVRGLKANGNKVNEIHLSDVKLNFCHGCQACSTLGRCVQNDDMNSLLPILKESEVIVLVTPIYFYEMSGQMKTFLDRTVPLYGLDNSIKEVYGIYTSQDSDPKCMEKAVEGIKGWIECYPNVTYKGDIRGAGLDKVGEANQHEAYLAQAYELGLRI